MTGKNRHLTRDKTDIPVLPSAAPFAPDQLRQMIEQRMFDFGPPLCLMDMAGAVTWANPGYRHLEEALATSSLVRHLPTAEVAAEAAARNGHGWRDLKMQIDGRPYVLRMHYVPLRSAAGKIDCAACLIQVLQDTEIVAADVTLMRERFDDVVRLVSDWVWETDPDLVITSISDRVTKVLGKLPRELVGRNLLSLGTDTESVSALKLRLLGLSPFRDQLFEAVNAVGETRLCLISAVPVFNNSTGAQMIAPSVLATV